MMCTSCHVCIPVLPVKVYCTCIDSRIDRAFEDPRVILSPLKSPLINQNCHSHVYSSSESSAAAAPKVEKDLKSRVVQVNIYKIHFDRRTPTRSRCHAAAATSPKTEFPHSPAPNPASRNNSTNSTSIPMECSPNQS